MSARKEYFNKLFISYPFFTRFNFLFSKASDETQIEVKDLNNLMLTIQLNYKIIEQNSIRKLLLWRT